MARPRYVPRPTNPVAGMAFESSEEAWLWAAHAARYAEAGANLTANKAVIPKRCEPRDVIALACRLRRQQILSGLEFGALCRFGVQERPPDARVREEEADARLWDSALDKLHQPLVRKGIVQAPICAGNCAAPCSMQDHVCIRNKT